MQIDSLSLTNFQSIGSLEVRLADRGLVLVQGENRDDTSQNSNGAGKSTLPDGLKWVLYGSTARGQQGDAIINRKKGKGTQGIATLYDPETGSRWRISRHRKHKTGKNSLLLEQETAAGWEDRSMGTSPKTQKAIDRLLGCSEEVFSSAIYFGQESMPDLPAMTDRPLKALIEEAAGITKLEGCYAKARGRLRDAEKAVEKADRDLELSKLSLERAIDVLAGRKEGSEQWVKDQEARVQEKRNQIIDHARKAKTLGQWLDSEPISQLNTRHEELQKQIQGFQEAIDEKSRLNGIALNKQVDLTASRNAHEKAKMRAQEAKASVEKIEELDGQECIECGRPHDASTLGHRTTAARDAAREAISALRDRARAKDDAQRASDDATAEHDAHAATIPDLSNLTSELQDVADKIRTFDSEKARYREGCEQISKLKDQYQALRDSPPENPWESRIKEAEDGVATCRENVDSCHTSLEKCREGLEVATEVAALYGPAGVRAQIMDQVTPFLNQRTAHYLSVLTDGNVTANWSTLETNKAGEVKEKFHIAVSSIVGADTFKGLSGGEKRKVRLATSMAMQDLVASRANKPINLYIADEIDHAVDDSGLERLMEILEEKARSKGSVLVISHNSLNDWIRESVTMVKENGESRLEGTALA